MPLLSAVRPAFDGSGLDGSVFTSITDFARETPWANGAVAVWTNLGLGVFALLMVLGWRSARRSGAVAVTRALAAPVSVVAAYAVAEVVKKMVAEPRPCRSLPHAYFVDACPAPSDYAFPSGHTAVAAAAVAALFVVDRRLSAIAAVFAVVEGFTRIYVGDHYPHDVLGSAVIVVPVAWVTGLAVSRLATPLVARLGGGVLRPLPAAGADAGEPDAKAPGAPAR